MCEFLVFVFTKLNVCVEDLGFFQRISLSCRVSARAHARAHATKELGGRKISAVVCSAIWYNISIESQTKRKESVTLKKKMVEIGRNNIIITTRIDYMTTF